MEVKPGYKQTEVGLIPADWDCTTVNELASSIQNAIVGGPFGSDLVSKDYVDSGVPVVRGQNMGARFVSGSFVFVTKEKATSLEANLARHGDLVFTQRGTLGQVSLVPNHSYDQYVVSQSQMKLTVNPRTANPLFFYYVFSSAKQQQSIRKNTIQTGVPHINLGILRDLPVQRPSLAEQEAIADALSDADALIDSLERLITKKRLLKKGVMQELLTGKKRLPGFSKNWETKRLDELGRWKGGMTPSMRNPEYWHRGTVPWISSGDVKSMLLTSTAFAISEYAVMRRATTLLPEKSIIVVTRSGILRKHLPVAMNMIPMAINQDIKALMPNDHVLPEYVLHTLTCIGDRILARCLKSGTTVESVEFPWLKAFTIPIPPLPEQTAIATILSDMDAERAALEARVAKARQVKQGMMQELLTGRIRLV